MLGVAKTMVWGGTQPIPQDTRGTPRPPPSLPGVLPEQLQYAVDLLRDFFDDHLLFRVEWLLSAERQRTRTLGLGRELNAQKGVEWGLLRGAHGALHTPALLARSSQTSRRLPPIPTTDKKNVTYADNTHRKYTNT